MVAEYGLWATADNVRLLGRLRDLGAVTWWFDGDRQAAFEAWQAENRRANRAMPDELWRKVVGVIDANWPLLQHFFGERILRAVESGPVHVDPEATYRVMAPDLVR